MDKKTIYLFFGEDTFSVHKKIALWRREFEKKHGDINIEILEGKSLQANQFSGSVEAVPFLGEKRLVIVNNLMSRGNKDEQKKIADILEKMPDTCVCVFLEEAPDRRTVLFKKINKVGHVQEYRFLTEGQLTKWILEKSRTEGMRISPVTATYMGSLTGSNLWQLENEIGKLSMYCKGREVIKQDVDVLVRPALTSSIFKLTDYLAEKNCRKSLETFGILKDSGEELLRILFMIVRHFRILIQVWDLSKKGYQKNQIISHVKEKPNVIQITLNQCQNFDMRTLRQIYDQLHRLDISIKTGEIRSLSGDQRELTLAIEKFIVKLCA